MAEERAFSSKTTALTIRLDDQLMEDLKTVAQCDGETVADAIRAAVASWVLARRADPNFQAALVRHIERAQRLAVADGGAS